MSAIYNTAISSVENYLRASEKLKEDAKYLVVMLQPSSINHNGKMGGDTAIEEQVAIVKADVIAMDTLGRVLNLKASE